MIESNKNRLRKYDTVVINGRIMDPLSRTEVDGAVAIYRGTIQKITDDPNEINLLVASSDNVLDAKGQVVAPGFINIHGHEGVLPETMKVSVLDGVTTLIGGNCGLNIDAGGMVTDQYPLEAYFSKIKNVGLYYHYATFIGHNVLRVVTGVPDENTPATEAQIQQMLEMVEQEMASGALGVSFGPGYHFGVSYEEMLALATRTAQLGGGSSIHFRYPVPPHNIPSLEEALRLAVESGVPLLVSHMTAMACGSGDIGRMLEMVIKAIDGGYRIAGDVTVYDAIQGTLSNPAVDKFGIEGLLQLFEAKIGDFRVADAVMIDGKSYMHAKERFSSIEQFKYARELLMSGKIPEPYFIAHVLKDYKSAFALSMPFIMVGNDAWVSREINGKLNAHPRLGGTFSKVLGYWVREKGVCDLMTGLYKISTAPALFLGLDKKGRIQEGCDADLVIFDPNTIIDTGEYTETWQESPSYGISHVLVDGVVVAQDGQRTGKLPGRILKRDWDVPGRLPASPWKAPEFFKK